MAKSYLPSTCFLINSSTLSMPPRISASKSLSIFGIPMRDISVRIEQNLLRCLAVMRERYQK